MRARSRGSPITGVRFQLAVIGYPRDFYVNYAALMPSFAIFSTVSSFAQTKFSKDILMLILHAVSLITESDQYHF